MADNLWIAQTGWRRSIWRSIFSRHIKPESTSILPNERRYIRALRQSRKIASFYSLQMAAIDL
jgi:hypothetical protein